MPISIAIPLYNKAPWVRRALQSVAAQSHGDFECIVVNDGSTDGGERLVAEFAKHDSRFRLINQANGGASAARNTAWQNASGAWVAFLDADDEWHPDFLRELVRAAQGPAADENIGIVATHYTETGRPVEVPLGLTTGILPDYFRDCLLSGRMLVWTSACAVRRSALQEVGGFRVGILTGQDVHCWMRIALRYKVYLIATPLACYHRDDPDCTSFRANKKVNLDSYALYARAYQEDKALFDRNPWAIKYFQNRLYLQAKQLWQLGYRSYALKQLWRMPGTLQLAGFSYYLALLLRLPVRNVLQRLAFWQRF